MQLQFIITQEQVNILGNILSEIPAKISLAGIDILRSLSPISSSATPNEILLNSIDSDKKENVT